MIENGGALTILLVVSEWGAPTQTFVRREATAAAEAGNRVIVLSLRKPAAEFAQGEVVCVRPGNALRTLLRHPVRSARALSRGLRRSRPDTVKTNIGSIVLGLAADAALPPVDWVHAHFAWAAASSADAFATVRRQQYSVFAHAHDIFDSTYVDGYTGDKLRRAAFVAVESPAIKAEVDERFGCTSEVVRMGVPRAYLGDGEPSGAADRQQLIVSVGSLVPKKGHDLLLTAVSELGTTARVEIIGEGPERARLEKLIRNLGISGRVRLLGAVPEDEVPRHLDSARVFCLASRPTETGDRDGLPNVLIEAMARGVPCVSTDVSGIPDLLGESRGIVVPAGDVAALCTALKRILLDTSIADEMAASARSHVDQCYRSDRNWALLEDRVRSATRAAATPDATSLDANRLRPSWQQHSFLQLRHLARALRAEADHAPTGLLVDLGCGAKPYQQLFGSEPYIGVDVLATHGRPDCLAVAENLPVRDSAAAVALSTQQLEHVESPQAVLREARRVLRPGGMLLLSTHGVWVHHPDPHDYWRWTEEGLRRLIEENGFHVERVHRQGGVIAAAAGLVLYPLGAARARAGVARAVLGAAIAAINAAALVADAASSRVLPRAYASPSYLVVARPTKPPTPRATS